MKRTVAGLFESRISAETAIFQLENREFPEEDISLLMSEDTKAAVWRVEKKSKAPEGAVLGAATGGVIGALTVALTSVTVATGGVGFFAAGPILASIAGAGAGGSAGGLVGALIGAGVPKHEAEMMERGLERGRILVGVRTQENRVDEAEEIFEAYGATSVSVS